MKSKKPAAPRPTPAVLSRAYPFPPAWGWFFDELVPTYVKQQFSPRESWKDKPFSAEDSRFFFRGIEELSDLFTEERPTGRQGLPNYFSHEKFRSAYLLYFLPLQAAKFVNLFSAHTPALEAALAHGRKTGTLRVADLGSGPGTASLALCLWLLGRGAGSDGLPEQIYFEWLDTSAKVLDDGRALLEQLCDQFPLLRGRVRLRTRVASWWELTKVPTGAPPPDPFSLILMGNVLNESSGSQQPPSARLIPLLAPASRDGEALCAGGGLLMIEPASRKSAQLLARTRDELLESEALDAEPGSFWGPCLHGGLCPLTEGRDWCHFSIPAEVPGRWFKQFSKALSSERQWLKFSYIWFAAPQEPAPNPDPKLRRVVSDPIRKPGGGGGPAFVLLSEPEVPGRYILGREEKVYRGDLITLREPRRPRN